MPRYLYTSRVTPAALQGLLKVPEDRGEAARATLTAVGATLELFYVSPDTMEVVEVWNCDDPAALDGLFLAVAASGANDLATCRIRRILTGAELAATARAADRSIYRPPGA